jgi:hypothetical protein
MGAKALPKKIYRCASCDATYPHDQGYWHASFECATPKG